MTTLVQAWTGAQKRLKAAGVDSPAIDARLLLEAAANVTRTDVIADPHRELQDADARLLEDYVERRARREPVARILGRKGFWKLLLNVSPAVLTPRPETETLVELALNAHPEFAAFTVLDLGVGSGAILLSILAERPAARGLGVDVSEEALAVARDNAANLGLGGRAAFLRTDWTQGLADESFDLVVANPPYIRSGEMPDLDPEVKDHEPHLALDGGVDGLSAYRELAPQILRVLKPDGLFLVEIGWNQAGEVKTLFEAEGGWDVGVVKDLGDRDRVVAGRKKGLGKASASR
ncbi:MAG TPA: peptide chain release factor N(5)-glutamine methyltransferase [Caulobacteraceae bacterium]|jgi:release factor glutamine methyltransferase|nr:peptide chain release factor N(5)-glutamine methyltransferase [Caulobacteraceae bacterium]